MFIAGRHVFHFIRTQSLETMSSSIYEIFHYLPPSAHQCPANVTSPSSPTFFVPLQTTVPFLPCQFHNMTDNYTNRVQLVDNNYLMRAPTHFDCYVLLFFARWCQFSVRFAPYFNAIPRAFPGLDFVAYDVSKSLRYMTYFGTNAVPSVFILRKNKLLARLNSTNDIHILLNLIESTLRRQNFVGRRGEGDRLFLGFRSEPDSQRHCGRRRSTRSCDDGIRSGVRLCTSLLLAVRRLISLLLCGQISPFASHEPMKCEHVLDFRANEAMLRHEGSSCTAIR